jgi:hypothetical protein
MEQSAIRRVTVRDGGLPLCHERAPDPRHAAIWPSDRCADRPTTYAATWPSIHAMGPVDSHDWVTGPSQRVTSYAMS